MAQLALFFLGAPRVEHNGQDTELDRHKSLALLAYLALTGQPHRRDTLAALLWPDLDQRRARAGLRRVLFSLQDALPGKWWEVERETVSVQPSPELWVDVAQFSRLLAGCREHHHPADAVCPDCLVPLTEAVETYRGDLLAGFTLRNCPSFDDWQFALSENLRNALARALELLVLLHSGQRRFEPAIAYARRWLALDALYEPAHQHLMRLYAWSEQRSAALRQYADCERLLEAELGVAPQAATRDLYHAIKDNRLPGPETVLRARQSSSLDIEIKPVPAAVNAPAAEAAPAPRISWPSLSRGTLVGRENEWPQATRLWTEARAGEGRVLLVSGEPGIGKSRLVHELADLAQRAGGRALTGECYTEGGAPYSPLAQIIRQGLDDSQLSPGLPAYLLADLLLLAPHLRPRFAHIPSNPKLDADFERQRLVESFVTWCLALAQTQPVLMVVEDVHWADSGTLALLHNLARRVRQAPLLLVLTFRDTEIDQVQARGLDRILLDLERERQAVSLQLTRLGRDDTGTLLAALLATGTVSAEFIDSVFRETEGNPFFVEETCRALIDQGRLYHVGGMWRRQDLAQVVLPRSVRAAILARVQRLPALLQETLRLAAVVGRRFEFDVLRAASPHPEEALITALEVVERLQLVSSEPQAGSVTFTFAHALIPFALRESLSHPRLRQLHAQVAAAIEAIHPGNLDELAYHYAAGGQRTKAIDYLRRAGDRAAAVYAYDSALQYFRQLLGLLEAEPADAARLEVMEQMADLEQWRGERTEAIRLYQATLDLRQQSGGWDKWAVVRLNRKIGETLLRMQKVEMQPFQMAAQAGLARALQMAESEPPHLETVRLLTTLAKEVYWETVLGTSLATRTGTERSEAADKAYWQAVVQGLHTKRLPRAGAEQFALAAIAMAEQLDAPVELSAALDALATDYASRQRHLACVELALRRLALSRDPRFGDYRERIDVLCGAGSRLAGVGQYARALPYVLEAESMASQIGDISLIIPALVTQAVCFFGLDRWDEMLQIEEKRRALEASHGSLVSRMCFFCGLSANVLALRGEAELSRDRREEAHNNMVTRLGPVETWPAVGHY